MYGIAELLRRRSVGIVRAEVGVIRLISVSAPVTFVFSGIGVVHDHAMVPVAIGDVDFVRILIDKNFRGQPEVLDVVTAFAGAHFSDLHQELSILSELHDHAVVEVTQRACCLGFNGGGTLRCLSPAGATSGRTWRCASAITSDPHITLVIDSDAMIRIGPFVALSLAAPVPDQISGLIKFENRRRRQAA